MGTEWQLTARPSYLSSASPPLPFFWSLTHTSSAEGMHPTSPLFRWSLWVARAVLSSTGHCEVLGLQC